VEIPQLKGNPYQSEGFKEKDVNSFESTFNLEKAKLIRTGMWLLVLAHVFNCFIVGTWIYQLITATSKLTAIDNEVAGLGLRLPAKITIVSIIFIPLALCLGTIGHILWLRAGSLIESRTKIGWSLGLWFASFLLPTIYLFVILPVFLAASAEVDALAAGIAFTVLIGSGVLWLASLHFMAQELKELSSVVRRHLWLEPALIEIGALLTGFTNFVMPALGMLGLVGLLVLSLGMVSTAFTCARGCSDLISQRNSA